MIPIDIPASSAVRWTCASCSSRHHCSQVKNSIRSASSSASSATAGECGSSAPAGQPPDGP
jgi:hypothetical protein